MKPWKAVALIVPAGLVLGMAAGAANRPVMVQNAKDYWSEPLVEARQAFDAPRPFYEGGPENLMPAGYSFRPDIDYDTYSWPDQSEPVPEFVATELETIPQPMVEVHRASPTQIAADRAAAAARDALAVASETQEPQAEPSEPAGSAPAPVAPMETAAF